MDYTLLTAFFVIALFSAMLLLLEVGRWIAVRRMAVDPEGAKAGLGAVVGVVFSLLGLLLAFTFSGAASRFDARKQLVVHPSRFRQNSRRVFATTSTRNCKQLRRSPISVRPNGHTRDLRR